MPAGEGGAGPGHAFGREQRGKDAVAAGERRGGALPQRQLARPRRAQRHVRHGSDGDGLRDRLGVEAQQVPDPCRGGNADRETLVPAALAQPGCGDEPVATS